MVELSPAQVTALRCLEEDKSKPSWQIAAPVGRNTMNALVRHGLAAEDIYVHGDASCLSWRLLPAGRAALEEQAPNGG